MKQAELIKNSFLAKENNKICSWCFVDAAQQNDVIKRTTSPVTNFRLLRHSSRLLLNKWWSRTVWQKGQSENVVK